MRQRKLKDYRDRLKELSGMKLKRDALLKKLGSAEAQATPKVAAMFDVTIEEGASNAQPQWNYKLRRDRLRIARRREGVYLLRTNLNTTDPKAIWEYYLQLRSIP